MTYCRYYFAEGDAIGQCALKSGSYRVLCDGGHDETKCTKAIMAIKRAEKELQELKEYYKRRNKNV